MPSTFPASPGQATPRPLTDPLAILSSVGEAVYDWDLLSDTLRWSPNAAAVLRVGDAALLASGRAFHELTAPASLSSRRAAVVDCGRADNGGGVPYQVRYGLEIDGDDRADLVWVDDTGRWFAGADGRPARAHGLVRVAAGRVADGSPGPQRLDHDPVTGCASRARLLDVLEGQLQRTAGRPEGFGLLLIGIADLASLNRQHGYDAVDELLAGIAVRLRAQTRSSDCLARYAGNRFALVLSRCDDTQIGPAAQRALDVLARAPVMTSAGPLPAFARVGGVLAPRHGRSVPALLLSAEGALDAVVQPGGFRLFDPLADARTVAKRTRDTAAEIVAALNEGRVRIASQPIVLARTGEIAMREALVRIVTRDGLVLEPATVLPAAIGADLLRLLDRRVFDLCIARLRCEPGTLSLNVSDATLRDPGWLAHVAAAARLYPDTATRVVFEVAEASAGQNSAALAAMRAHGARIAIDHFGAGHASVETLRQVRPDYLKIDGAFVQNLSRSPDDRFLVRALLAVSTEIGAPAIAEWVENATAAATLTDWGVPFLQGTHFGAADLAPEGEPILTVAA